MKERLIERFPLVRPLFLPALLYIGLAFLATTTMEALSTSPWRVPVLLSPVVPGAFLALGVLNVIRKLDEMNRKIILESAAVAFAVTLFVSVPLGLLETGGVIQVDMIYLMAFMAITWLVAKLILARRYE